MSDDLKTLQDDIMAAHRPELVDEGKVTQLWSDGEVTSTKGKSLFGLHSVFTTGVQVTRHPLLQLPSLFGLHSVFTTGVQVTRHPLLQLPMKDENVLPVPLRTEEVSAPFQSNRPVPSPIGPQTLV